MPRPAKVLLLWNQVQEDIYVKWRAEGPRPLDWAPEETAVDVETEEEEIEELAKALRGAGLRVDVVNIADDFDRLVSALRDEPRPDCVFNLVEYFNDDATQEPYVAGLYELLRVAYTGCPPRCLSACQRKARTKVILEAAGLPTPPYFLAELGKRIPRNHGLGYPLIVKPVREDASGGIDHNAVVHDYASLRRRVLWVHAEFKQHALVERYIHGREIHASVIGNGPTTEVLPLLEFEFEDDGSGPSEPEPGFTPKIVSYDAKWNPHARVFYSLEAVVPARHLPQKLRKRIESIALEAYRVMGCRDYARVDMRVDKDDAYVLEVNPNPDLSEGTGFMLCAEESGRSFAGTVVEIASMALERAGVSFRMPARLKRRRPVERRA